MYRLLISAVLRYNYPTKCDEKIIFGDLYVYINVSILCNNYGGDKITFLKIYVRRIISDKTVNKLIFLWREASLLICNHGVSLIHAAIAFICNFSRKYIDLH